MRVLKIDSDRPGNPSPAGEQFLAAVAAAESSTPPEWRSHHDGAPAATIDAIRASVAGLRDDVVQLSHDLYADPELGFQEHRSVARVAALLERHGVTAQVGAYGLDTALVARVQSSRPGPTVAVLAEYDCLPDIGHGCGHNMICGTGVAAFLALAAEVEALGGRAVLLGTPAEENGSGKELMIREGALEGVDVAMMVHPFAGISQTTTDYLGLREVDVTYTGRTAHASASPFLGVNALDAVVAAYNGVSAMRQQLIPTDRVHGIIVEGGTAPNVIPEKARGAFYVRSATTVGLAELSDRLEAILTAAAHATGCAAEIVWDRLPPCLPLRSNDTMVAQFAVHFTAAGETMFGPPSNSSGGSGSTDMGNVSVRIPAIHPMIAIAPAGISLHTKDFADHAAGQRSDDAMMASAYALASVGADILADPDLLAAIRADFDTAGGVPTDLETILGQ